MFSAELTRIACPLCQCDESEPERVLNGFGLERCSRCRFVFMNPRYAEEDLDEIYTHRDPDELIELYGRIASPQVINEYNRTLDLLESLLPGRGRLLDFACAAGYFFEQAARRGWVAHGADIGEWTREAAEARGLANLHVGRLSELGFGDGYFDVVYAAQAFEHLLAPKEDLAELRRVLRPGGLLYVDVPNYRTLSIVLGKDDFVLNRPPQHVNYFTPRTLRALLRCGGFDRVRVTTSGGLKWENLIGRSIRSPILDAYGLGDHADASSEPGADRPPSRLAKLTKSLVLAGLVKPVFYDRLRVGVLLIGIARRPG